MTWRLRARYLPEDGAFLRAQPDLPRAHQEQRAVRRRLRAPAAAPAVIAPPTRAAGPDGECFDRE